MTTPSIRTTILASQIDWATRRGLPVDDRGYVPDYAMNLRAPLSAAALAAFEGGSGSELRVQPPRRTKMCALHSSSALAVNVFDFWSGRDLDRVGVALEVEAMPTQFEFEAKLPSGARGIPPNLDLLVHFASGGIVGVESKFTEWMTPKRNRAASLSPYLSSDESSWSRAQLPAAHRLACDIAAAKETFRYLDVPQLLKHALGLAAAPAAADGWQLRYVYFDATSRAQAEHAQELARFQEAVGAELGFRALTYQALVAALGPARGAEEEAYLDYVRDRYFQVAPAG